MRSPSIAALAAWFALGAPCVAAPAHAPSAHAAPVHAALTAEKIVEKNIAARGGADAWHKVQTMVWVGHLESEHAPLPSMGFVLEQKRPNKTRFQLIARNQRTVRIFDGTRGWKLRPGHGKDLDVQPYTLPELRFAQTAPGIDGPLIDHAAKGTAVALEGVDEIEGRKAYRLSVRLASGETDRLWIDAHSFLEVRYDRPAEGPGGGSRTVSVSYRDYKANGGLQVPSLIVTGLVAGSSPDKMVIERVVVNAPLEDRIFSSPGASRQPGGRRAPPVASPAPAPAPAPTSAQGQDPGPTPE